MTTNWEERKKVLKKAQRQCERGLKHWTTVCENFEELMDAIEKFEEAVKSDMWIDPTSYDGPPQTLGEHMEKEENEHK